MIISFIYSSDAYVVGDFNTIRSPTAGLHNSESSKGQIDQHKLAAGRKSLFRYSVEEILKGQVIIRSRAFATFSATEFSRAACGPWAVCCAGLPYCFISSVANLVVSTLKLARNCEQQWCKEFCSGKKILEQPVATCSVSMGICHDFHCRQCTALLRYSFYFTLWFFTSVRFTWWMPKTPSAFKLYDATGKQVSWIFINSAQHFGSLFYLTLTQKS